MDINHLILFDGVCNLCNGAVRFIIKRDKKGIFKFASLQSDYAKKVLNETGIIQNSPAGIILVEQGKACQKSTAVLKIARHLSGGWSLCSLFLIIPRVIRDGVYDFIAKRRYTWFGKRTECMLPKPEWKDRFAG